MKIVLFEPQIPQNTGNIIRTCSVTNCELILVRPLGFKVNHAQLKRAGLDYIDDVKVTEIDNLAEYLEKQESRYFFFSSKVDRKYSEISFKEDDILIFGSEPHGMPQYFHEKYEENFYTIPMKEGVRSLNLANSVCIVLYEGLRQLDFAPLDQTSNLSLH